MKVFGFNEKDFGRVNRAVVRSERFFEFPQPTKGRPAIPREPGVVPAVPPTGGIALGTPASPTSGTGYLYLPNSGGPGLVADTNAITIYNTTKIAVPSTAGILWVSWFAGYYYCVSWDGC